MSLLLGLSTACLLVFPVAPVQRLARAAQIRVSSLAIAELQLPSTLNPLLDVSAPAQDIASGVFESLLMPDTHNVLQPSLAASWSVSGDGRTYTFALDPRARWQDGVAFSAEDVLFTAKLIRDPKFPAVNRFGFGYLTSLRADGPLTVTATLRTPYAPFLRAFAGTPIVPAHVLSPVPIPALAAYTAFNRHPIGTGPYMVTEFVPGDHVTLGAYSGYYRGSAKVGQLVFRQQPSLSTAISRLEHGDLDVIGPSAALTPQQVVPALANGRLSAFAAPGSGWTHIDLIESGFLRDHIVRQALTLATPRQRLVSTLFSGLATLADADQPPTSVYFEPAIAGSMAFNPSRVAPLLGMRGYKLHNGVWRKFNRDLAITLYTDAGCDACLGVARQVAAAWSAVGVPTRVKALDQHKLFGLHGPLYNAARLYDPNLSAVLYTWATAAEPDDTFYWATSTIVRPGHLGGGNFDGYSNPAVDRLMSQALLTVDESKRVQLYRQVQRALVNDQPDVFLYWTTHLTLATAGLHGYRANPYAAGLAWNAAQWSLS
jgi:peptide/nickel transport system substrate-binding protein